jgi:uncharacterized protein
MAGVNWSSRTWSSSTDEHAIPTGRDTTHAIGRGDREGLLALVADDIEWIIPGENWPLAGTHRGHAELAAVLQKASEEIETTYPTPPEFVAQGDRVLEYIDTQARARASRMDAPGPA